MIWGEHKEDDSKKNILEEEKNEIKSSAMETITEDFLEEKSTSGKSFVIDYIKGRTVDKVVEYRRSIYDSITKNNNTLSNTTQMFIPTKKYSDNTVDFLLDSYVTVIFENKK